MATSSLSLGPATFLPSVQQASTTHATDRNHSGRASEFGSPLGCILSTPLDFTLTRENLAAYVARTELSGDGWTFSIASDSGAAAAQPIHKQLALVSSWSVAPLTLEVAPRLRASTARWVDPVRFTAAGVGLVLALGLSLFRTRSL